jgi:hypothetical protein
MKQSKTPTIFLSGRYFASHEIAEIQDTVRIFSRLSWLELVQTICEHLEWVTPAGKNKVDSCAKALMKLQAQGLLKMPVKNSFVKRKEKVTVGKRTDPESEMSGTVRDYAPIQVNPATESESMRLWNEYVERYHRLRYKRPFGAHQRYFIVDKSSRRLGCLLFASSAWALAERDRWIGWTQRDRELRLNLVVANTRFLIFPWVHIKNLASTALSLAAKRIRQDWQSRYGYKPVLLETFVEPDHYRGVSYQASNWIQLGVTSGRGRTGRRPKDLLKPKLIYVYPLVDDFRSFLQGRCHEQAPPPIASSGTEREESGTKEGRKKTETTAGSCRLITS